jgi:uncharacterized membrane protein
MLWYGQQDIIVLLSFFKRKNYRDMRVVVRLLTELPVPKPSTQAVTKPRPRPTRGDLVLRALAVTATIAFVIVVALSRPSGSRTLALATTKQPEAFTELYFGDHLHLPKQVEAGRVATVSYHITNHEGASAVYHPRVTLYENGSPRDLGQTAILLQDGQGQDLAIGFTPQSSGANLELVIDLPDRHQSIHFRSQS